MTRSRSLYRSCAARTVRASRVRLVRLIRIGVDWSVVYRQPRRTRVWTCANAVAAQAIRSAIVNGRRVADAPDLDITHPTQNDC